MHYSQELCPSTIAPRVYWIKVLCIGIRDQNKSLQPYFCFFHELNHLHWLSKCRNTEKCFCVHCIIDAVIMPSNFINCVFSWSVKKSNMLSLLDWMLCLASVKNLRNAKRIRLKKSVTTRWRPLLVSWYESFNSSSKHSVSDVAMHY